MSSLGGLRDWSGPARFFNEGRMHWYYDNEGQAEGPLDDEGMASLFKEGRLVPHSLIWQPDLDQWSEIAQIGPEWAEPPKKRSKTASVLLKLTGGVSLSKRNSSSSEAASPSAQRKPKPVAPSGTGNPDGEPGLFKRLFGMGRKKGG